MSILFWSSLYWFKIPLPYTPYVRVETILAASLVFCILWYIFILRSKTAKGIRSCQRYHKSSDHIISPNEEYIQMYTFSAVPLTKTTSLPPDRVSPLKNTTNMNLVKIGKALHRPMTTSLMRLGGSFTPKNNTEEGERHSLSHFVDSSPELQTRTRSSTSSSHKSQEATPGRTRSSVSNK